MNDGVADDPASRRPGACGAAIPIVYPNQPITVPYDAIRGEMSIQCAAVDEVESVRRTFTRLNTAPPRSIASSDRQGVRVLGLGHAGVAFVNGITGEVAYYEYGRYGGDYGAVRDVPMPNLTFDEDGNPERGSFNALARTLTRTNTGPYAYEAVYVKLPNGSFDVMKEFSENGKATVQAQIAAAYDVEGNHCFTFALEVAESAGVNGNVLAAADLEIILIASVGGFEIDPPEGNAIELPSRQMRTLQGRYRPLNLSRNGSIEGSFAFPDGFYAK